MRVVAIGLQVPHEASRMVLAFTRNRSTLAMREAGADARIKVKTFKYDGRAHRTWRAELVEKLGPLLILHAKFEEEISHSLVGTIAKGTESIEYYWLDRWYNVFRFMEPTGQLQSYYCNVTVPPVLHNGVLSYIDLDMDIMVAPDLSFTILDEDEFAANSERYAYPQRLRWRSYQALDELVALIRGREFPFDSFK